ncbi:hypothetical protein AB0B45_40635 [Nonomuraea sp. NPDC049152]|uniref:hypothetical protein n=1 Tax=Nonomuraea sp. NPDC049152 TaxID=3154350 RepID=UPI0033E1BE7B
MISVDPGYKHIRKLLTPGERLALPGHDLKWYDLRPEDVVIPDEVVREARAVITPADNLGELGFVILHRVGPTYLLLLCTWRGENELWETVYGKTDGPFERIPFDDTHKGTYCVWEMGALMHEQQAWITYLLSERDERARSAYLEDVRPASLI